MVQVPPNTVTPQNLAEWYKMKLELAKLKASEMLLRTRIFGFYFPKPKEGTNSFELGDEFGSVIKGKHTLTRDVDPGALEACKELFKEKNIPVGKLISYKPQLSMKEYNQLTEEQKAIFNQVLIIKEGSPALEIVIPKKRGSKTVDAPPTEGE